MKTIQLKSWEHFEEALSEFQLEIRTLKKTKRPIRVSDPLFRGHACASWKLVTTLERLSPLKYTLEDYYRVIRRVRPAVVTITGNPWDLPQTCSPSDDLSPPVGYEFMVYLRHHGFPSPLLDWSRSPYVAAFFAFRNLHLCNEPNVSIYSYVEYIGEAKGASVSEPIIIGLGPYVISHKRHFAQQCEYTICKKYETNYEEYCSHEDAVANGKGGQDDVRRFVLPKSERAKALKKLELLNVTMFSLFGNEESLMETLAYQEIEQYLLSDHDA